MNKQNTQLCSYEYIRYTYKTDNYANEDRGL